MTDETRSARARDAAAIEAVLDAFHAAAAVADEARYFDCLAPNAVFIGTAPGERWEGEAFRAFVRPLFAEGTGWSYASSERTISLSADGRTAWFDERLENDSYGECRGTGVLRREDDRWLIEQYALSIPVPDEIAAEVVARIREAEEA